MKAPEISVIIKVSGDGYGHNSYQYVAYYFDFNEATERAEQMSRRDHEWFEVERVPAGDPMPASRESW